MHPPGMVVAMVSRGGLRRRRGRAGCGLAVRRSGWFRRGVMRCHGGAAARGQPRNQYEPGRLSGMGERHDLSLLLCDLRWIGGRHVYTSDTDGYWLPFSTAAASGRGVGHRPIGMGSRVRHPTASRGLGREAVRRPSLGATWPGYSACRLTGRVMPQMVSSPASMPRVPCQRAARLEREAVSGGGWCRPAARPRRPGRWHGRAPIPHGHPPCRTQGGHRGAEQEAGLEAVWPQPQSLAPPGPGRQPGSRSLPTVARGSVQGS